MNRQSEEDQEQVPGTEKQWNHFTGWYKFHKLGWYEAAMPQDAGSWDN